MKKLIVISDWVDDTLACQEFRSAVEGFVQKKDHAHIYFVSSTPSTIHSSFLLAQTIETEERYGKPQDTILLVSTDFREDNKGINFIIIRLKSGIYICGPNAGYVFSMIKRKIEVVFTYEGIIDERQFRSRDLYSRICAHLIDEMQDELELEEIHTNIIPELKGFFVTHVNNFGNLKTTIKMEDMKGKYEFGDEFFITINKIRKKVKFVKTLFSAEPGVLIIYPGSSGKTDNPYLEIAIRRHFNEENVSTGQDIFRKPRPGKPIEINE